MKKSDSIENLAKALAKFQKDAKDPRKAENNPFYKSKYVSLDSLLSTVRPQLAENGLSFIQIPSSTNEVVAITTLLMHESGEWIESDPFYMKVEKQTPQGAGSAVTYGRRYSLSAILGVAWETDDDGDGVERTKNEWWDLIIEKGIPNGKTVEGIKLYAKKKFNAAGLSNLTAEQLTELEAWAASK